MRATPRTALPGLDGVRRTLPVAVPATAALKIEREESLVSRCDRSETKCSRRAREAGERLPQLVHQPEGHRGAGAADRVRAARGEREAGRRGPLDGAVAAERDGRVVEERLECQRFGTGVVLGLRAAQHQHGRLVRGGAGGGEAGRGVGGAVGRLAAAQDGGIADEHVADQPACPRLSAATQRSTPLNGVVGTAGTLPAPIASAPPWLASQDTGWPAVRSSRKSLAVPGIRLPSR